MSSSRTTTAELKQQVFARHKKGAKKASGIPKMTTVAAYGGVFLLIMSMVAIGYQPPQKIESVANAVQTQATSPSVDELVAINVAASIAERADLSIAKNVANLSLSLTAQNELVQNDSNIISKPQIIQPTAGSREVKTYVAQAGDTVDKIATQFNVSATTVKWANNLTSDAVEKDKQLTIPPVDGVVYSVKDGDTIDSLASKYKVDKDRIVSFNDLELTGLSQGRSIILPGGELPDTERPGYVPPRNAAAYGSYGGGYSTVNSQLARATAGNRYAAGNCTWYAYERRIQLGLSVGSFWGNATTWAPNARAAGYQVSKVPTVGAIAHWSAYQGQSGYAGHVAIVESVNADGSITISEMNYLYNYGKVTSRTINPGDVTTFIN